MRAILITFLTFMLPILATAQYHGHTDHEQIESLFIGHITLELDLTPQESQLFWPIYNEYKNQSHTLRHKHRGENMQAQTDAEAQQVLDLYLDDYETRVALKRKFYKDLSEVISPLRVLKFKNAEHSFKKQMISKMKENKGS